jgi:Ca2+-binding EF-hand superfamily protein
MEFLSVISKGTTQDKLSWAFTFYDLDNDGTISMEEMLRVTDAVHELMGDGASGSQEAKDHVSRIFNKMNTNCDGKISLDEFVAYCTNVPEVRESMSVLP